MTRFQRLRLQEPFLTGATYVLIVMTVLGIIAVTYGGQDIGGTVAVVLLSSLGLGVCFGGLYNSVVIRELADKCEHPEAKFEKWFDYAHRWVDGLDSKELQWRKLCYAVQRENCGVGEYHYRVMAVVVAFEKKTSSRWLHVDTVAFIRQYPDIYHICRYYS